MKALLISIKPKWVAKILKGEKTIEVRKKFPKDYKGWVYIYCTKDIKDYLYHNKDYGDYILLPQDFGELNGKVVARFYCDKVEDLYLEYGFGWQTKTIKNSNIIELKSCLTKFELYDYFKPNHKRGYAIHISNLEIFDKPKELKHFRKYCEKTFNEYSCIDCKAYKVDWDLGNWCKKSELILTKAPQSFMFIEVEE